MATFSVVPRFAKLGVTLSVTTRAAAKSPGAGRLFTLPFYQRKFLHDGMSTFQPIVLCGPSGSGKSTIVKKLMAEYDGCFAFSVSHTTRKPRPGEKDGTDYFFSERADVENMIKNNEFIEHAEFSGNLYGTSIKAVQDVQATGRICILDVDMQGVKSIKGTDLNPRYIFVKPPSEEVLEQRLRGRGTETEESLQKRLRRAKAEMEYGATPGTFDHTVVNDNLEDAYTQMKGILNKDLESIQSAKGN